MARGVLEGECSAGVSCPTGGTGGPSLGRKGRERTRSAGTPALRLSPPHPTAPNRAWKPCWQVAKPGQGCQSLSRRLCSPFPIRELKGLTHRASHQFGRVTAEWTWWPCAFGRERLGQQTPRVAPSEFCKASTGTDTTQISSCPKRGRTRRKQYERLQACRGVRRVPGQGPKAKVAGGGLRKARAGGRLWLRGATGTVRTTDPGGDGPEQVNSVTEQFGIIRAVVIKLKAVTLAMERSLLNLDIKIRTVHSALLAQHLPDILQSLLK